jgi:hypothetical protein
MFHFAITNINVVRISKDLGILTAAFEAKMGSTSTGYMIATNSKLNNDLTLRAPAPVLRLLYHELLHINLFKLSFTHLHA